MTKSIVNYGYVNCVTQAPINDDYAASVMIGIRQSTNKAHLVRALLESLAFRVRLLYDTEHTENSTPLSSVFRLVYILITLSLVFNEE